MPVCWQIFTKRIVPKWRGGSEYDTNATSPLSSLQPPGRNATARSASAASCSLPSGVPPAEPYSRTQTAAWDQTELPWTSRGVVFVGGAMLG
jgi:hypothetical protein